MEGQLEPSLDCLWWTKGHDAAVVGQGDTAVVSNIKHDRPDGYRAQGRSAHGQTAATRRTERGDKGSTTQWRGRSRGDQERHRGEVPASPRVAVSISFIPNPHKCRIIVQVLVPRIATRRVFGPLPRPREATAEDESGGADLQRCTSDEMCARWQAIAKADMADAVGVPSRNFSA